MPSTTVLCATELALVVIATVLTAVGVSGILAFNGAPAWQVADGNVLTFRGSANIYAFGACGSHHGYTECIGFISRSSDICDLSDDVCEMTYTSVFVGFLVAIAFLLVIVKLILVGIRQCSGGPGAAGCCLGAYNGTFSAVIASLLLVTCVVYSAKCNLTNLDYAHYGSTRFSFGPAFFCTIAAAILLIPSAILSFYIDCVSRRNAAKLDSGGLQLSQIVTVAAAALPAGWQQHADASGKAYYASPAGVVQWDPPAPTSPPPPPPPPAPPPPPPGLLPVN